MANSEQEYILEMLNAGLENTEELYNILTTSKIKLNLQKVYLAEIKQFKRAIKMFEEW